MRDLSIVPRCSSDFVWCDLNSTSRIGKDCSGTTMLFGLIFFALMRGTNSYVTTGSKREVLAGIFSVLQSVGVVHQCDKEKFIWLGSSNVIFTLTRLSKVLVVPKGYFSKYIFIVPATSAIGIWFECFHLPHSGDKSLATVSFHIDILETVACLLNASPTCTYNSSQSSELFNTSWLSNLKKATFWVIITTGSKAKRKKKTNGDGCRNQIWF